MPTDVERKPEEAEDEVETPDGIGIQRARTMLGELALRAGYGNERITLTRKGRPIVALIGMKDLERLNALDAANTAAA